MVGESNLVEDHARSHSGGMRGGPVRREGGKKRGNQGTEQIRQGSSRATISSVGERQCEATVIHFGQCQSSMSRVRPLFWFRIPINSIFTLDVVTMSDTSSAHGDPDLHQNTAPHLGVPGTPDFFASVLRFIRSTAPGVPLDPVIFQSIILSVMAGNKHVLLRTRDEDTSIVQNLAALVSDLIQFSSVLFMSRRLAVSQRALFISFPPPLSFPYELIMRVRYSPTYLATPLTNTR